MGVKPGYKQTEVGVIPEDWAVTRVGDVCGFIVPGRNKPRHFDGEIPWITTPDLVDGRDVNASRIGLCVSRAEAQAIGSRVVPTGSVLMSCAGELGITAVTSHEVVINQQLHAFIPSAQVNAGFLLNAVTAQRPQIQGMATKTAVPYLNKNNCNSICIPLPPVAEQEAIAEALSDADALIESLEQLLVKKCDLKQGAMQELLTGKKRLPGFGGEWNRFHFRDLLAYERPDRYIVRDNQLSDRGAIPVLTANKSFVLGYTFEEFGIYQTSPVIIFDDFTTDTKYVDFPFKIKSSAIKLLKPITSRVNLRFIFDRMQLIQFPLGDHKRYYISEYQGLELAVPDYEEQCAVAAALIDMNAEIAALEAKLAKARDIKQGMMQELLTGRIRLL